MTNHGVDQANKLGDHLARSKVSLTHIFSSPLTRTSKTSEAILKAQTTAFPDAPPPPLSITKVPDLIEQDFGYYEGKSFHTRSADSKKTGRELHREKHKDDPGFVDVESKESMAKRADRFLDEHLLPLFEVDTVGKELEVAIVSHGILLSNLWRRLLLRLPRRSLTIAPEITASRGDLVLEHLGGWSNTGYLNLTIRKDGNVPELSGPRTVIEELKAAAQNMETPIPPPVKPSAASVTLESTASDTEPSASLRTAASKTLDGHSTVIVAVDSKQHLLGLKRQRGGIGRSAHDESQKKLDGFFKKQRTT